jgi:hypothetical protein
LILSADNYSGKNECICSKCAVLGETPTKVFLDQADLISSHENGDFCTSPPTSILNGIDDTGISFIKKLDSISDEKKYIKKSYIFIMACARICLV